MSPAASGGRRDRAPFQCVPRMGAVRIAQWSHAIRSSARVPIGRTAHLSKPRWLSIIEVAQWTQRPRRCCSTRCRCSFSRRSTSPWAWRCARPLAGAGRMHAIGFAIALVFPCVGLLAAAPRHRDRSSRASRSPVTCWLSLAGILLAALPLARPRPELARAGLLVTGCGARARPSERSRCATASSVGAGGLSHRLLDAEPSGAIARSCSTSSPACSSSTSRTSRSSRTTACAARIVVGARRWPRQRAADRQVGLARATSRPASAPSSARASPSRSSTPRARRS